MPKTPDERLHRIKAECEAIARAGASAVRDSAWLPQEVAAALAEKLACVNIPDVEERSAEWLDTRVAACEAVAAEIRAYKPISGVHPQSG